MARVAKQKLLIVEDDIGLQSQLEWAFEAYEVVVASDRRAALSALRTHKPAVVTLDLGLPPDADGATEGLATLREIIAISPETKVIVASGHEARESAQTAIALGAFDFYAKPIVIADLGLIVARAFHIHALEAENQKGALAATSAEGIVTGSAEMMEVLRTVDKVADAEATVMLLGASGTGKELLAKAIHTKSSRARGNFVAINCAAIPDTLLEAELFGHERGAFTGAVKTTIGKIEMAQGGTLFLDEIGDVPAATQVKLLRFLQERVIERIGGRKMIPIDARVITATHQDLPRMMRDGQFREDLYFRLAEVIVKVPTLAERQGDAVLLARHFLQQFRDAKRTKAKSFAPDALAAIAAWPWTGNVRELENRVKRATIMADGPTITARDLDLGDATSPVQRSELRVARERADRLAITEAIAANNGNLSAAARDLDISRPMLYDLMNTYGIPRG
ncbi:MAG: PEP-CTERM-box response regulator transcription factor [Bradyrhizobium sp.]|nr:PEP-CTERM-box response regulator transcription factor [Bradyrhizobium sp.]